MNLKELINMTITLYHLNEYSILHNRAVGIYRKPRLQGGIGFSMKLEERY